MKYKTFIAPFFALSQIARQRELIFQLIRQEVIGRYRGSFAGLLWTFLTPLISLGMYTFVFGVVFKSRWGLETESTLDFSLVLFAGLILHGLLAECINRAPSLILGNPSYVKQVVFPLEILPVVALGSSLFHFTISLGLLILVWATSHGSIDNTVIFIPFLVLPLCLIALGLSWLLAATTVYFRDIGQLVSFISSGLLFFSPIFYKASSVPEPFRSFLDLNPLTFVIEHLRGILINGELPDIFTYLTYLGISIIIASSGYIWFQKTRAGFADVI